MRKKSKGLVLDSWAALAYLDEEPSSQSVADLISDALEAGASIRMSVVNAAELWTVLAREVSDAEADRAVAALAQLGVEFVEADWGLTRIASGLAAKHKISLAHGFAAALAKDRKSDLVTGDKQFRPVDGEVSLHWL